MEVGEIMTVSMHSQHLEFQEHLNEKPFIFTVYSGAITSIINWETYVALGRPKTIPVKRKLQAYGRTHIPVRGQFIVEVKYKESE